MFAEELANNIPLSRSVISEKMASKSTLKNLTTSSSSIKKVANYLTYQQRKSPDRPHPPSTRVEKWVSAIEETASRVSARVVRSAEDTAVITEHLKKFAQCPDKPTIEQLFDKSDQLANIVEQEGFNRCYEKVKNIMEKWRKEAGRAETLILWFPQD